MIFIFKEANIHILFIYWYLHSCYFLICRVVFKIFKRYCRQKYENWFLIMYYLLKFNIYNQSRHSYEIASMEEFSRGKTLFCILCWYLRKFTLLLKLFMEKVYIIDLFLITSFVIKERQFNSNWHITNKLDIEQNLFNGMCGQLV